MSLLRGVGLPNQFSHKAAKDLAGFASSYNSASQVVAWASADGATTGTKLAFLNGEAFVMPADAAFDWSADPQLGAWVTATSYDAYDMRYVTDKDGKKHYYQCIASHTSGAANKMWPWMQPLSVRFPSSNLRCSFRWLSFWLMLQGPLLSAQPTSVVS
jgi:hypothetical protein